MRKVAHAFGLHSLWVCSLISMLLFASFGGTVAAAGLAQSIEDSENESLIPFGEAGVFHGYEIRIVSAMPHADQIVAEENSFNAPPASGSQFFMVRISLSNTTSEPKQPRHQLVFIAIGGLGYPYLPFRDRCGVYPDELISVHEVASGETVEFNVCWNIDNRDQDSLVMFMDTLGHDAPPTIWFSLEETATPKALALAPV